MTDGTREYNAAHYRLSAFYDLAKTAVLRLAFAQGKELAPHGCTAVALTPGWMRSEMMLEHLRRHRGELARRRRPATRTSPRSPRARASSAARSPRSPPTPTSQRRNGGSFSSGGLAREYGFTDVDGSQPDCWRYMVEVQDPGLPAGPDRLPLSQPSPRTIAAPAASASSLPNATSRGRYFMPQSGAATMLGRRDLYGSARRMRSATVSAVSTVGVVEVDARRG